MLKHGEFQGGNKREKKRKEPDAHWVPGIRTRSTPRAQCAEWLRLRPPRSRPRLRYTTRTRHTRNKKRSGTGRESEPRGVIAPANMAQRRRQRHPNREGGRGAELSRTTSGGRLGGHARLVVQTANHHPPRPHVPFYVPPWRGADVRVLLLPLPSSAVAHRSGQEAARQTTCARTSRLLLLPCAWSPCLNQPSRFGHGRVVVVHSISTLALQLQPGDVRRAPPPPHGRRRGRWLLRRPVRRRQRRRPRWPRRRRRRGAGEGSVLRAEGQRRQAGARGRPGLGAERGGVPARRRRRRRPRHELAPRRHYRRGGEARSQGGRRGAAVEGGEPHRRRSPPARPAGA